MYRRLRNWYRKLRGLDVCPDCDAKLGEWGYCSPCNNFPRRKWINEAEALWVSKVQFERDHPDEYAAWERRSRKTTVSWLIKENRRDREFIVSCYGEDLVKEVEDELASEGGDSQSTESGGS